MRDGNRVAIVAAGVTVVLWASAFVAIRHVGTELSAGPLSLARLLIGSLVLGLILLATGKGKGMVWKRPAKQDWTPLLACGLLWFGVYNVALNAAERRLDAGTAAMLVHIAPLLIALLAGLMLGEGFPRQLVIGSLVAFGGVLLIGTATSTGRAETWGVVLCVAAAVSYAVGVVAQKPLLKRLPAAQVTWLACMIGTISCLPYTPDLVREVSTAQASTLWWVVYLGAFPTALGFTTWAFALSRTSAGRMGATTYLVPVVAIGLAWLFLGETPALLALGGGVLCLLGVGLSRRTPKVRVDAPVDVGARQ
ncbi:DMT family transporter [Kribbella caucasensis]|uniref:DMT family transporter n=1 Tax=Kribbella caucasensis TaxID=2512215 RepID=UPI00105E372C|nr:DMT family transporter [Kribbella sp. VKM Ac-2527]